MSKLQRVSSYLQQLFIFCVIAIPLLQIISWALFDPHTSQQLTYLSLRPVHDIMYGLDIANPVTSSIKFFGFCASLLLTIPSLIIFYLLSRLFGSFKQNIVFERENAHTIRWIGYMFLGYSILMPLHQAVMTFILTMNNPVGEKLIGVSFGTPNIEIIITALIVIVIAWVMEEAHKLKEQEALTI